MAETQKERQTSSNHPFSWAMLVLGSIVYFFIFQKYVWQWRFEQLLIQSFPCLQAPIALFNSSAMLLWKRRLAMLEWFVWNHSKGVSDSPKKSLLTQWQLKLKLFEPDSFGLSCCFLGGGSKLFFIFTPIWGRFPFRRAYFSEGWFNHQLL